MSSADRSQVSVARLRQLAQDALVNLGVSQEDAAVTADVLVDAELSGVESHGLMRLPVYAKRLADGAIDPRPDIRSTVNGATALMDGGNGLGPVVAGRAADLCSQLAGQYGVGVVSVRRSNHFGTADLGDIILPMLTEDITAFAAGKEPGHIVNRQFLTTAG